MRVTLDTNVWSRLSEREEVEGFERLEQAVGFEVVIPPSTVLEALRTRDPARRRSIVQAITSRGRTRIHLRSEARMEADELVSEIARLRRTGCGATPIRDLCVGSTTSGHDAYTSGLVTTLIPLRRATADSTNFSMRCNKRPNNGRGKISSTSRRGSRGWF
jgi:hypothetical protein